MDRAAAAALTALSGYNSTAPPPSSWHGDGGDEAPGNTARPLANFHPSVWGEFFIQHYPPPSASSSENQLVQQRVEMLKEQVRTTMFSLSGTANVPPEEEMLKLVDALQRLGLAYHFEKEIDEALTLIHTSSAAVDDLRVVSLRFRLLRRGGHNISSDEFNKLIKDVDGRFRGDLIVSSNIEGLLSLYDAFNCVGTQEDGILEEAMSFCRRELESMLDSLQPPLAAEVVRSLDVPLVRRIKRLEVREYLSFYKAMEGRNDVILELAKLDFNCVQSIHQEEIRDLTRWWKELGLIRKLNFARDRLVEGYFWILAVCCEPHLTHVRIMMTKVACLVSVLDDIYDSYGTLEELQLLTDVMQRWDIDELEIPEYMKTYFEALSNTLNEFEDELLKEQKSYCVRYLKEEFKMIAKAYLKETEWCNTGHTPTFQDHLQVSLITSGTSLLTCGFFLCMRDLATQDIFEWFASNPKIVEASAIITRLIDDIASHQFEENRQHVVSAVRCYMKEYNVPEEVACRKLREMGDTAWKVMNEEWIQPTQIPRQLLAIPFDLARVIEMYYKAGVDGYTHSSASTKEIISSLLVEPIPL